MIQLEHKFVETNGIEMHYVQSGTGPLVVLCHGWPESWYSWRHQITALAAAGYQVVAPDQRGYGQTDAPQPIESYNILNLAGDIVGLVNALGASAPIIIGHDWGAPVAWYCALLRPDLFRAYGLLSVPYMPRMPIKPSAMWTMIEGNDQTLLPALLSGAGQGRGGLRAGRTRQLEESPLRRFGRCARGRPL